MGSAAGRFVDLIYAAVAAQGCWRDFLEEVAGLAPNGRAVFAFRDAAAGRGAICLSARMTDEAVSAYNTHYCHIDPWAAAALRQPVGQVVHGDELVPRQALQRTEFYTGFLKPQGLESAIGFAIRRDGRYNYGFGLLCGDMGKDRTAKARRCLEALVPHLQKAFDGRRRGGRPADGQSRTRGGWRLRVGAGGKVVAAEGAAAKIVEAGAPLRIDRAGRLGCATGAVDAAVGKALAGWGSPEPFAATLHLPRGGEMPLRLTLSRQEIDGDAFFRGPECLVVIEDLAQELGAAAEAFGDMHGLTPAQRRAVLGVVEGLTPQEIAAAAGTTPGTVRLQIKHVFQRTGLNRQIDLVRHVCALAAAASDRGRAASDRGRPLSAARPSAMRAPHEDSLPR